MSAVLLAPLRDVRHVESVSPAGVAEIVLIGTGQVGRALLNRLARHERSDDGAESIRSPALAGTRPVKFRLIAVANSRYRRTDEAGVDAAHALRLLDGLGTSRTEDIGDCFSGAAGRLRIIVDATASEDIASKHADWLEHGIHVVTANKLGAGGPLARWQAIRRAAHISGSFYGDSATVGAGLPFLSTLRALRAGGDRIHSLQGVLSGTWAWLFDRYDGTRPFSELVRQAQALGYTEPDAWQDLSGVDVVRKLLVLARATGNDLDRASITHEPLLPDGCLGDWAALDAMIAGRFEHAANSGQVLRYIAEWREDRLAQVGLLTLDADHPLAARGAVNRLAIHSCRYDAQPLLIEGPGAGPGITAAALFDDLVRATHFA